MKKLLAGILSLAMIMSLTGCVREAPPEPAPGDQAVTPETSANPDEVMEEVPLDDIEAEEPYPANEFEERVGKYSFESYDEIIGLLEGQEAYAYVDIFGAEDPILLVTSYTFDNLDGNRAAIDATPYIQYADGSVKAGSVFASGSTATPLALSKDGCIFIATHSSIEKDCLGENGTDTPSIMVLKYAYVSYGDDLKPETYGGFLRETNTVIDNDGVDIAEDDDKPYREMFDEYETAQVINFTVIDPSAVADAEPIDP